MNGVEAPTRPDFIWLQDTVQGIIHHDDVKTH
jgi:hypothetical protein